MPEELDPSVQHARQRLLQEIVEGVREDHAGDDLATVLAALQQRLEDAQFPPQPEKWERDTASEIADGRHVVVDRALGAEDGPEEIDRPERVER